MTTDDSMSECSEHVCTTCSDEAVEATVVKLFAENMAIVDTGKEEEEISVGLVSVRPGDVVLVHAGEAIAQARPVEQEFPAESFSAESLYPFLGVSAEADRSVMSQVRQSIESKAREIMALRGDVLRHDEVKLIAAARDMANRFRAGGRLLAFGNGGSSSDAQDCASLFLHPGPHVTPLPAFGLTSDIAVVTALSNDVGFDVVFARQLAAFGDRADIAVGMSTSGNSANLLRGFDEAAERGMLTVGIAGDAGGKMAESSAIDYLFVVPSASVHRIQEAQTTLYHALWELTLRYLEDEADTTVPTNAGSAADVPGYSG